MTSESPLVSFCGRCLRELTYPLSEKALNRMLEVPYPLGPFLLRTHEPKRPGVLEYTTYLCEFVRDSCGGNAGRTNWEGAGAPFPRQLPPDAIRQDDGTPVLP